jgi:plastocyanin
VLGKLGALALVLGALVAAGCTSPTTTQTNAPGGGTGPDDGNTAGNNTTNPSNPAVNGTISTPAGNAGVSAGNVSSVTIVDNAFQPSNITATAGSGLNFTNTGQNVHSVTIERGGPAASGGVPFFDQDVNPGQSVLVPFPDPGTYYLHCKYHPEMTGNITVT